ncbi:hypothetical protein ACOI22_04350 [Glaciecola sp. 2405UD65-10]|uniref:hypothetical protein n=1 Tax=Glaciecola sp. 2405UD65-10 TaxID=3397244 RepID=UPI003B5A926A
MSRPLEGILRKGKQKVAVKPQMTKLLMMFADNNSADIAKLLRSWLNESPPKLTKKQ